MQVLYVRGAVVSNFRILVGRRSIVAKAIDLRSSYTHNVQTTEPNPETEACTRHSPVATASFVFLSIARGWQYSKIRAKARRGTDVPPNSEASKLRGLFVAEHEITL